MKTVMRDTTVNLTRLHEVLLFNRVFNSCLSPPPGKGIFDHATLKNYFSVVIYISQGSFSLAVPYKAIPHWKGQKLNFEKKNISVSGNP